MTKLGQHFTLKEFTDSETARKYGIKNNPTEFQIESIRHLVMEVLQPLRYALDKPIFITSGFRSEKLNEAVNGSKNSHHLCENYYAAADIVVSDLQPEDVQFQIRNHSLPIEECINEYDKWIHVSARRNENQFLKAIKDQYGKSLYEEVVWV